MDISKVTCTDLVLSSRRPSTLQSFGHTTTSKIMLLTDLPLDIIKVILDYIPLRKDLAHLSLVCSSLRILAQPWLYNYYDITFEYGVPSSKPFACLFNHKNTGAQYIRHLEIKEIGDIDSRLGWGTDEGEDPVELVKTHAAYAIVELVLQRIPAGRLQSFRWNIPLWIGKKIPDELEVRHHGIKHFSMMHQPDFVPSIPNLLKLELPHLVVRPAYANAIAEALSRYPNIKKLAFDVRAEFLEAAEHAQIMNSTFPESMDIWSFLAALRNAEEQNVDTELLKLETLRIRRLPVNNLSLVVDLRGITSLIMHDCINILPLFESWSQLGNGSINLKKFRITLKTLDTSGPTARQTITCLEKFITSFSGLRDFSFLNALLRRARDESTPVLGIKALKKHSSTLETLVLHDYYHRHQSPRHHYYHRTQLELIALYKDFPALKALGISIDYNKLDASNVCIVGLLAGKLRHLRICNHRVANGTTSKDFHQDAHTIAAAGIRSHKNEGGGPLKLIIIGGDAYNHPEYFYIEKAVNVLRERVPIVTRLSERKAKDLEGSLPVMKHMWWFMERLHYG